MSIMAQAGLLLKRPASAPVLVGIAARNAAGTLNYPAGTQTGDFLVLAQHGGGVPSGWTLRVNTGGGSQNGYTSQTSTKVCAGETSVTTAAGVYYDAYLFVFRGASVLDTTVNYADVTGGGTRTYTVASTPKNVIAIGWDRGASGYPTSSPTGRNAEFTYSSTYFRDVGAYYPNMPVGSTVVITDYNDTYSTDVLFLTVT